VSVPTRNEDQATLGLQMQRGLMNAANKRAGGIDEQLSRFFEAGSFCVADTVRGDEHERRIR